MKDIFYCPKCKCEMKFKDMKGCLSIYCPICGDTRMVDYPEKWEELKHEYIADN